MTVILCSPTPAAIIKAVLLSIVENDLPCMKGQERDLGLFGHVGGQNADQASLPILLTRLTEKGINGQWLREAPGDTLRRLVAANLRYSSPDRAAVAFAAIEEALSYGHSYAFSGIGDISKLFLARYRAVSHEVHKMTGFVRFHPAGEDTLVARPKLFHNTADLILRVFAPRYPNTRLVFLLDTGGLALDKGKFTPVLAEDYQRYIDEDPFSATWEQYYRSQYIASRKNLTLAQRFLPKKYWDSLSEGRILEEEAKNWG